MALHPNLSFEQAPPMAVPMRFFLTAPWFGVAAGLLLFLSGEKALATRWMPETLALVHLVVAGFMLQAMCGALLQFVPVAAGGNVRRPRLAAAWVHPGLILGVLALVGGFLSGAAHAFLLAAVVLAPTLTFFVLVVGDALRKTPARSPTVIALRLAVVGLFITILLGAGLASALGQGWTWPFLELTDFHASWGLIGWALALLAGVSYYVVPMFQLTPPYPSWFARAFAFLLLGLLLLGFLRLTGPAMVRWWQILVAGAAASFATVTLVLQEKRRRKLVDTTFLYFRTAMIASWVLATGLVFKSLLPSWNAEPRLTVWLGVLALHGGFVSVIAGMLGKIVPFIGWLHLQRQCPLGTLPPTMNQLLAEPELRRQLYSHWLTLALLLGAVWLPSLASWAGAALVLECAWLGGNLLRALRRYRAFRDRIRAAARDRES